MPDIGVTKTVDNVARLLANVAELTASDVLVGVPAAKTARKDGAITNASLAYIHEFGSPAHNIPARPFLFPGVRRIQAQAKAVLRQGALDVLRGVAKVDVVLNKVGILARNSVVNEITDPEPPFIPLRPATIRARLRRTAAGRRQLRQIKTKRSAGVPMEQALTEWAETGGNIHPLLDTGALRASISYVVVKR